MCSKYCEYRCQIWRTLLNILCTWQVSLTDHGRWMCLMNENSTFNSVKQWLDLAVAVVPSTGVTLSLAGDTEHDADTGEEEMLLS